MYTLFSDHTLLLGFWQIGAYVSRPRFHLTCLLDLCEFRLRTNVPSPDPVKKLEFKFPSGNYIKCVIKFLYTFVCMYYFINFSSHTLPFFSLENHWQAAMINFDVPQRRFYPVWNLEYDLIDICFHPDEGVETLTSGFYLSSTQQKKKVKWVGT